MTMTLPPSSAMGPRLDDAEIQKRLSGFYTAIFQAAIHRVPYEYQIRILTHKGPLLINKARQTGISTAMSALAVFHAALLDKHVLVVSNKWDSAKHILQYAWDFIRPLVDYGIDRPDIDQSGFIRWAKGGEIRSQGIGKDAGRGFDVDLAIMDEFAWMNEKEGGMDVDVMKSVGPTLSQRNGRAIILSTPNGMQNEFARMWHSPDTFESSKITIHYTDCPTLHVREETLAFGKRYWVEGLPTPFSESAFLQEFCNRFDVSETQGIPAEAIWAALAPNDAGAWL